MSRAHVDHGAQRRSEGNDARDGGSPLALPPQSPDVRAAIARTYAACCWQWSNDPRTVILGHMPDRIPLPRW